MNHYFPYDFPVRSTAAHYGPLWDVIVYLASKYIFTYPDYYRVLHAMTFSLLPLTLLGIYALLLKAKTQKLTAIAAVIFFASCTRFVGHALVNAKDFPAAAAFVLCSVGTWVFFRKYDASEKLHAKPVTLLALISFIPFAIRPPLLLHSVLSFLFLILICLKDKDAKISDRIKPPVLFLVASAIMWSVAFPSHRLVGTSHYAPTDTVTTFVKYHQKSEYESSVALYYLEGLLNLAHPMIVITLMLLSIVCMTTGLKKIKPKLDATVNVSLQSWLSFIFVVTLLSILFTQPVLYNKQRQILFAYALIPVMAALALQRLPKKSSIAVMSIVAVLGVTTTAQWGHYSYVYGNNLHAAMNMESKHLFDYWKTCNAKALDFVGKSSVPSSVPVYFEQMATIPWAVTYSTRRQSYYRFKRRNAFYPELREMREPFILLANDFESEDVIRSRLHPSHRLEELYAGKLGNGYYACAAYLVR